LRRAQSPSARLGAPVPRQDAAVVTRALWLNGTVGAGKTSVGAAVADRLAISGEAVAFVDTDALGDLSPRPPDDPFNTRLVAKNLAAVTANFSAAGARSLVVAGVIQAHSELELYARAIGAPVTLVRLLVPAPELVLRLRQRHGENDASGLRWHVDRAPTLAAILDASGLPMLDVTNAGDPDDTARAVIAAAGWEPPGSS
jgi:adenylylsulfate kinase